jgi:PII-like signaling protein
MLRSTDHAHHHSLATELIARARKYGMRGATLLEAVEGQGPSGAVHRQHLFREDTPISLVIVDETAKIASFVDDNREVLGHSLVVVDDVTAFRA